MKKLLFSAVIIILTAVSLQGQTTKEFILENPVCTRAHYSNYPAPEFKESPAPEGYAPVYMSHYGRHGSRYHVSRSNHTNAYKTLKAAKEAGLLTDIGEELYRKVRKLRTDAKGRDGALTPVGTEEHRGIAERMYKGNKEIFTDGALIDCRSTQSPRCILSMAANNERLKELNPELRIIRTAYEGDEEYLRNETYRKENKKDMGSVKKSLGEELNADGFAGRIFKDGISALMDDKDMVKFMKQVYAVYQICGCTSHTGINLDDVFTPEELFELWRIQNAGNYVNCGNSKKHGKGVLKDVKPLLKDILERADDALAGNGTSADLRFGHDVILAPLVALLNINGYGASVAADEDTYKAWADFIVMPMGANLQFIFYRNADDDVIVKVMHNEVEGRIPGLKAVEGSYYRWKDLRQHMIDLIR